MLLASFTEVIESVFELGTVKHDVGPVYWVPPQHIVFSQKALHNFWKGQPVRSRGGSPACIPEVISSPLIFKTVTAAC